MKLFKLLLHGKPPIFIKADTKDEAVKRFQSGLSLPSNPQVEEIGSLERLMELLPSEFKIDDDASF